MSKKIVAFSFLSLCVLLCGCWQQNNSTDNQCVDDTCIIDQDTTTAEARTTNKTTSEIESDIAGFDENSDEVPLAEKVNWEPITISGWDRDM